MQTLSGLYSDNIISGRITKHSLLSCSSADNHNRATAAKFRESHHRRTDATTAVPFPDSESVTHGILQRWRVYDCMHCTKSNCRCSATISFNFRVFLLNLLRCTVVTTQQGLAHNDISLVEVLTLQTMCTYVGLPVPISRRCIRSRRVITTKMSCFLILNGRRSRNARLQA
jgi:hypothetical protein